jgi:hypothetical protein
MSAVLSNVTATLSDNGADVTISAPSIETLQTLLAKLQAPVAAPKAAAPKPTQAPAVGNVPPASTPAPASVPAASAGSESPADVKGPTYDDVRARILALAKISKDTAVAALAKFGVDAGPKLKLEQYADFLVHADQVLGATRG